jgi:uncharacterized membrane protein (UPF0127 family)
MNKLIFAILIFSVLGFFLYFGNFVITEVAQKNEIKEVLIGNKKYELEVVKTSQDLEKGLAKFENINDNQGMLFIFDTPGRWSIWMKDMKFNIDIVFLNENKEVVTIFQNVKFETHENVFQYRKYLPELDSKYVIELKEGEIEKNKIKLGDKINF